MAPGAAGPQQQAERWFVRLLEPDCPGEDRAAFERWRAADPAHAAAYRAVERLWRQGEQAVLHPEVMAAAQRALRHTEPQRSPLRRWLPPLMAVAAAAAIAVIALPRLLAPPQPPPGTRHATAAGEQRSLTLADGSTVVLDTATVLLERYNEDRRRVDLQQGQAQFQVRGDPQRPFAVHTPGGRVTAVGTRFQVRTDDGGTAVTLIEGQVQVATEPPRGAPQTATLAAGQRLRFDRAGTLGAVQPADLQAAQGWTEGKVYAHHWRLHDLLAEMNRYSPTQLRLADPALSDLPISGVFRTGDQDTLVRILQQGWSLQAERTGPDEVELSQK